jgi:hypothetical protein
MHKTLLLIIIAGVVILITAMQAVQAQHNPDAGQVYGGIQQLPYASKAYSVKKVSKTNWKIKGKDLIQVNKPDYIKKPYHNPNLVQINRTKKEAAARQKQQAKQQEQQDYQKKLTYMCQNSLYVQRNNRNNGYARYYFPRTVYSRQVVPFSDYRQACKGYIQNNRLVKSGL